jgi:hypothetical protein
VGFSESLPGEAKDAEDDGQDSEASYLNRLPAHRIDRKNSEPVARQGTGADKNDLARGCVAQIKV